MAVFSHGISLGAFLSKGVGTQMGTKEGYRGGKDRLWAWLRSLFGEPVIVLQPYVSPQPQLEGAVLPCQGMPTSSIHDEDEIDLFPFWQVIWRARHFIGLFTLAATLLAALVSFFVLPVTYKSEAVLMPTDSQGGSLGSLATLATNLLSPINLPTGAKSDVILNFLQSRNLQQRMIEKYNLLPRLYKNIWDARQSKWLISETERHALLIKALQKRTLDDLYTVTQDTKTDLITISWEDKEPAFSAEMLKGVIAELSHYLNNENESDAKRERRFVEKQLSQTVSDLGRWERQIPTTELTLADIQRERLTAQVVYTEMRKQLELAKIAEAKELVQFKVLDSPFVPENHYKPMRLLICAATLAASAILAILWVFVYHAVRNARQKREQNQADPLCSPHSL